MRARVEGTVTKQEIAVINNRGKTNSSIDGDDINNTTMGGDKSGRVSKSKSGLMKYDDALEILQNGPPDLSQDEILGDKDGGEVDDSHYTPQIVKLVAGSCPIKITTNVGTIFLFFFNPCSLSFSSSLRLDAIFFPLIIFIFFFFFILLLKS